MGELMIIIDADGRTVLPKAMCLAVNLGNGGSAKVRLAASGIIEIEPVAVEGRLKKVGKFLVGASDSESEFNAAEDVRAERDSRCALSLIFSFSSNAKRH